MTKTIKKAFTLVEMMIVIAVIAVLAGVAVSRYYTYVKKSETTEAIGIMRNIVDAEMIYFALNDSYRDFLNTSSGAFGKLNISIPSGLKFKNYKLETCLPEIGYFMIYAWTGNELNPPSDERTIYMIYPPKPNSFIYVNNYINGTSDPAPDCKSTN